MPMLVSCAIGYTRVTKAPDVPLRNYKIIEIPDLSGSEHIPAEVKISIPNQIGVFGGGIDETYAKIAEEIVHFIKSNY